MVDAHALGQRLRLAEVDHPHASLALAVVHEQQRAADHLPHIHKHSQLLASGVTTKRAADPLSHSQLLVSGVTTTVLICVTTSPLCKNKNTHDGQAQKKAYFYFCCRFF